MTDTSNVGYAIFALALMAFVIGVCASYGIWYGTTLPEYMRLAHYLGLLKVWQLLKIIVLTCLLIAWAVSEWATGDKLE
jgi:hypothetical protein